MLCSSGDTETITFFVNWVKEASPVRPSVIMTDRDNAQIAALRAVHPDSPVYLCIWHVLKAMRAHLNINEFDALWKKVIAWVKTDDLSEFQNIWHEIRTNPSHPQSFVSYLESNWLPERAMWSRASRKGRTIYEEVDTNMLIEA
jgi:MULE transposase domain